MAEFEPYFRRRMNAALAQFATALAAEQLARLDAAENVAMRDFAIRVAVIRMARTVIRKAQLQARYFPSRKVR